MRFFDSLLLFSILGIVAALPASLAAAPDGTKGYYRPTNPCEADLERCLLGCEVRDGGYCDKVVLIYCRIIDCLKYA